ncbi:VOC family protein [Acidaminobacter sp. JC074]|uniref:VOC family protein n=1 Tax=Acidaminobacter sp. JC074 TaxID=2530199 RepID=UPI001F0FB227|nr:VOC family protein [Acidaminobacter sp. JC074]
MLKLGSTYLIVKNMEASIDFYSALLEMKPTTQNEDRWVQFDFHGSCIALWNPDYDTKRMGSGEILEDVYSETYMSYHKNMNLRYGNNVVLNFYIDDLKEEYERLKNLDIGHMTPMMYINVACPYHLFIINDPDGNQIEITGNMI